MFGLQAALHETESEIAVEGHEKSSSKIRRTALSKDIYSKQNTGVVNWMNLFHIVLYVCFVRFPVL